MVFLLRYGARLNYISFISLLLLLSHLYPLNGVFGFPLEDAVDDEKTKDEFGFESDKIYTNNWAIQINGDLERAKRIAEKHGFEKVSQVKMKFSTNMCL